MKKPDLSFDISYGKNGETKVWIDGTNEWRDLQVTLDGFMPWNSAHEGCVKWAREIMSMLDESDDLNHDQVYFIGGHSMGGALATEVADLLWSNHYKVKLCVTYGAYGTGKKVGQFFTHYMRNEYDIVPFLFPWWIDKSTSVEPYSGSRRWPFRFIEAHQRYDRSMWKNL